METRKYYIYGIVDPRDQKVFYVGAAKRPTQRLRSHTKNGARRVKARIDVIRAAGMDPTLRIFTCVVGRKNARYEENILINMLPGLLNTTKNAGASGASRIEMRISEEDKKAITEAAKKKRQSVASFIRAAALAKVDAILGTIGNAK